MALLELFTYPHCPSRRHALRIAQRLRREIPSVQFKEHDLMKDFSIARSYRVSISPSFVLDGKLLLIGVPDYERFKSSVLKEGRFS